MFDFSMSELMLIGAVALIAIGPKELPGAIYQLGKWTKRARLLANEARYHLDELMHQAELDELRKTAAAANPHTFDRMIGDVVDPDQSLRKAIGGDNGANGYAGSPPETENDEYAPTMLPLPASKAPVDAIPPTPIATTDTMVGPVEQADGGTLATPPPTDKTA